MRWSLRRKRLRRKKKYKVYKALMDYDGQIVDGSYRTGLYSICGISNIDCQYKKGEVTTPPPHMEEKGYFLFAFKTLRDAKRYGTGTEVWIAETDKNPSEVLPEFLSFDGMKEKKFYTTGGNFPEGTVMCKNLKLLYKVWDLRKNAFSR